MHQHEVAPGVYPTMITPFTESLEIDSDATKAFVEWLIGRSADGLFAVCQSSEMFELSLRERVRLARMVVESADGRVPVIASGHVAASPREQAYELAAVADTGIDALVLVVNRLMAPGDGDDVFKRRFDALVSELPQEMALGFYECPYPYHALLSDSLLEWLAADLRVIFVKDTCCDVARIERRAGIVAESGGNLRMFNANSASLLHSLRVGYVGYSGVMANVHPELYVWLCRNWEQGDGEVDELSNYLGFSSLLERQYYPVNAKYLLNKMGVTMGPASRRRAVDGFAGTMPLEMDQFLRVSRMYSERYVPSAMPAASEARR